MGLLRRVGKAAAFIGILQILTLAAAAPAAAEKRVALVVGNSAYAHVPRLANPTNDARLMAETLRSLGFALIGGGPQLDLDKVGLDRAVQQFGRELQGAAVGLFYYAGHGVQVRGGNYLVPVGANPTREADIDFQMLDTNLVLRQMEGAGTRLNLVILDACRNNPFGGRGLRATGNGLAHMQAPEGTLISFATQPGNVAQDGADGNSPFTDALARTIHRPGLGIFDAFNEVGLAVKQATGGAQQPWVSSSPIAGSFYFAGLPQVPDAPNLAPQPQKKQQGIEQLAVVAPPVQPVKPPAPIQPAVGLFDGNWVVTVACQTDKGTGGYTKRFYAEVKNGILHGEYLTKGQPAWLSLDGRIQPDGSARLTAKGLTGRPDLNVSRTKAGSPYGYSVNARFDGSRGTGRRVEVRSCDLDFVKE